jgi:saccharopine dehydrogenase-like NADP-dependent oxidoreductase
MNILILGSGLMGPAAAHDAMLDPQVSRIVIADVNPQLLDACAQKFSGRTGAEKLSTVRLDLADQTAAVKLMGEFDVVISAVPWGAARLAIRAAMKAGKPLVDFSWPISDADIAAMRAEVDAGGGSIIFGCGVEPGITEILARYAAEQFDRVDELHICCGGIPEKPTPPLGYKIVYGGNRLPFYDTDPFMVKNGKLVVVPRYSEVESVKFAGVRGNLEAWHEGFMPWLLEIPQLSRLKLGTQKTVRYSGYAAKVAVLKELGLLSLQPVNVDGVSVPPKRVVDAVLYPKVKMESGERDITVVSVEAIGKKSGRKGRCRIEMVDRFDTKTGFTSMARVTAFTAAIVARMIGRGELKVRGMLSPEKVIAGKHFTRFIADLSAHNVKFTISNGKRKPLA